MSAAVLSQLFSRERKVQGFIASLNRLPASQRPDPKLLPEALTMLSRKYSIEVQLTGRLVGTGATVTQNVSIATDKLLSRRQINDVIQQIAAQSGSKYGLEYESHEIVGYMRSGPAGIE